MLGKSSPTHGRVYVRKRNKKVKKSRPAGFKGLPTVPLEDKYFTPRAYDMKRGVGQQTLMHKSWKKADEIMLRSVVAERSRAWV